MEAPGTVTRYQIIFDDAARLTVQVMKDEGKINNDCGCCQGELANYLGCV